MVDKAFFLELQDNKLYIFGAQSRAKTLKGYLNFLYPEKDILCFIVDDAEENEQFIDGIPVCVLDEMVDVVERATVFIATKGIYHDTISEKLKMKGFLNILPVTVDVDNFLRNEYVKKHYELQGRSFIKLKDMPSVSEKSFRSATIFMAKSIYDKPLQTEYICLSYEQQIQVGAALTEERLALDILTDNIGDNISSKNRQYCELTALYWIWKNATEDVVGLSHYRRHFILPENWQRIMESNNVDVILPVPTYVAPSITENYKERHDPEDWDYLLRYLKTNSSEDYEVAENVFNGNLYLPCNMFIMRREILDELCKWMFPILDAVVKNGGTKEDTYLNRYPGFVSERLITLFFSKYKDKYRIVYADKTFLQ